MSAAPGTLDWTDANQRYLVAQLARVKARVRGDDDSTAAADVEQARRQLPAPAAIDSLAEDFGLSDFERDLLLLCAGVEMDGGFAELCTQSGGCPHATFGLGLAVLADPHWSALTPVRPLRRWRLLEVSDDSLVSGRLRIDERVLHHLAGVGYLDVRVQPLVRQLPAVEVMAGAQEALAMGIGAALEQTCSPLPAVQLWGDDEAGRRDVASRTAALCGVNLHALAGEDIPADPRELEALARLWDREAVLQRTALLVECRDTPGPAVSRFVDCVGGLVLLSLREPVPLRRLELRHQVVKPGRGDQLALWAQVLNGSAARFGAAVDDVASEMRLSAHDVRRVGTEIVRVASDGKNCRSLLWDACRGVERVRLDGLAQRIETTAEWDDLVLPAPQKSLLERIATHVRQRATVYERWGFEAKSTRGLGIGALFAGESGTGKTMAAEVLARELHLDLFRIDLSAVVSKYIGETEKNLARLFDAADGGGAILLFDEADALFGKRSEVKDSHDRYANIEVSYLLQRMESFRGLAILTTNQKAALDTAFQRRLRFVVHFPFPDASEREEIWRRVFPEQTPTAGLAYAKLGRLHMPGGNIRNIALNAAFSAAEAHEPVTMVALLSAAHAEAAKRERPLAEAETRGWV